MVFAAAGHIPPTVGALLQEAVDVAVILNALRAAGGRAFAAAGSPAPIVREFPTKKQATPHAARVVPGRS
jgi:hypothetical protein